MEFNGTFFVSIISFLVFVFIMNKLLYEPVHKIVKERNDFINGNYDVANANNAKADELDENRNKKIIEAKEDGRGKYNELLAKFKEQRTDIVKNAQAKTHEELEKAYSDLSNVSNEAKENLKWKMTDLANDIVEKVLGYRSEVQGFDNDKINNILYNEKG
jgi:F-type H+-transporting ATPase subunit b